MQPESTTKRAALYTRVSTIGQEQDGTSLDTQEGRCRAYAAEQGYQVVGVYREVHTGTELWERPQLTALRAAVRRREVHTVIAYAIDRLARDPVHLGVIISEAEHAGVAVLFVTEPLDNSPEGQLIRFVRGYAAKIEHEKIKERSMRGKLARARAGRPLSGSRVLYGYRWKPDRTGYEEAPEKAAVVRRIFAWAAEGVSLRGIASRLIAADIPTPTGKHYWSATTVHVILSHPAYRGAATAFRYQAVKNPNGKQTMRIRAAEGQIALPEGTVPPLADPETFDAVQSRLALNKAQSTRNNRDPERTLLRGGYVRCGYCGRGMAANNQQGQARAAQYVCPGRADHRKHPCPGEATISAQVLDAAAWERVHTTLTRPETITRELHRLIENDPTAADLVAVDRQIADSKRQIANLADNMALLPAAAAAVVREKLTAHTERLTELEAERASILVRRQGWQDTVTRMRQVESWCNAVAARLHGASYELKRLAIEALGVRVRVWRADHTPRWTIEVAIPLDDEPDEDGPILAKCPASSSRPRWRECAGPISASRRA